MTQIHLQKHFFSDSERTLLETSDFRATVFLYPSGVHGLRLHNSVGYLELLPFQGQQIWDAVLHGRSLTMKSMFDAPQPTRVYLENYGALLLHCGVTAMGVPVPGLDTHPLHGELPNAPYQAASVRLDTDENGTYIALTGSYRHSVAFAHNYVARPEVRLYANSSLVDVRLEIENLKNTPMDLMYLAHLNLRPVDNAKLEYSAIKDPEHVRIRADMPAHAVFPAGFKERLEQLRLHPELHHTLEAGVLYSPEIVYFITYQADSSGWAHSLQIHPDGSADYVKHRPEQLPVGVRWLTRTPDQDGLGLVLPSTSNPSGYSTEKAAGRVVSLAAKSSWHCQYQFAALESSQVPAVSAAIKELV